MFANNFVCTVLTDLLTQIYATYDYIFPLHFDSVNTKNKRLSKKVMMSI